MIASDNSPKSLRAKQNRRRKENAFHGRYQPKEYISEMEDLDKAEFEVKTPVDTKSTFKVTRSDMKSFITRNLQIDERRDNMKNEMLTQKCLFLVRMPVYLLVLVGRFMSHRKEKSTIIINRFKWKLI